MSGVVTPLPACVVESSLAIACNEFLPVLVDPSLMEQLRSQLKPLKRRMRSHSQGAEQPTNTPSSSAPQGVVWLRLGIMSHGRAGNPDYLMRTLYTIMEQMPTVPGDPIRQGIDVVVVNNQEPSSEHRIFTTASAKFGGMVRFVNKIPRECKMSTPRSKRTPVAQKVQRQSCDIAAAMDAMLAQVSPSALHVMLLEDDWLICPHALEASLHLISKAYRYDPDWIALRVSYGFNGIIVRGADMSNLRDHIANNHAERPPDHLVFEWFAGEPPLSRCPFRRRIVVYPAELQCFHVERRRAQSRQARCYRAADSHTCAPSLVNTAVATRSYSDLRDLPLGKLDQPSPLQRSESTPPQSEPLLHPEDSSLAGQGSIPAAPRWEVQAAEVRIGESCSAACERLTGTQVSHNQKCDAVGLSQLNNCESLERYMTCIACQRSLGVDQANLCHACSPYAYHQFLKDECKRLFPSHRSPREWRTTLQLRVCRVVACGLKATSTVMDPTR
ncbi:MAG: hypothetical protein SGPRY_001800 [Prymnesium sp.]